MSTVTEIRKKVIDRTPEFVDLYFNFLQDTDGARLKLQGIEKYAESAFNKLAPVLLVEDDPSPIKVNGKTAEKKINHILTQVAKGDLTPRQAKAHMELVQLGVDITELPKLIKALENTSD